MACHFNGTLPVACYLNGVPLARGIAVMSCLLRVSLMGSPLLLAAFMGPRLRHVAFMGSQLWQICVIRSQPPACHNIEALAVASLRP